MLTLTSPPNPQPVDKQRAKGRLGGCRLFAWLLRQTLCLGNCSPPAAGPSPRPKVLPDSLVSFSTIHVPAVLGKPHPCLSRISLCFCRLLESNVFLDSRQFTLAVQYNIPERLTNRGFLNRTRCDF